MIEWIPAVAILGLIVGSFLNVVILRLPRMLESAWRREAQAILELPPDSTQEALSLWLPPSHCPSCKTRLRPWHNVPLLSWLWLRARCASCRQPISCQYPLVEALTALLSAICAWHFGLTPALGASLLATWLLVAMTGIDLRTQLLPDVLSLPLLWLGLLASIPGWFTTPVLSILGAATGYLSLWLVYRLHHWVTGREGLGGGDFKLLAALGAWLGVGLLPSVILLSSGSALLVMGSMIVLRGRDHRLPFAFGPYLAASGWWILVFGDPLRWAATLLH
jgi:leader peptidase (prepilin peptidase)/N-methyltransferase